MVVRTAGEDGQGNVRWERVGLSGQRDVVFSWGAILINEREAMESAAQCKNNPA